VVYLLDGCCSTRGGGGGGLGGGGGGGGLGGGGGGGGGGVTLIDAYKQQVAILPPTPRRIADQSRPAEERSGTHSSVC